MTRNIVKKFVSAVLSSVMAIGIMVVIVEDGYYDEMPYYEGSFVNPINTPYLDALYQAEASYSQGSEEAGTEEAGTEGEVAEPRNVTNATYVQDGYSAYNSRAE